MKLRLLTTKECNRGCAKCCNNQYDLDSLPVETNFTNYEEIILTGGEPMLYPRRVRSIAKEIRLQTQAPIYLHTADISNIQETLGVLFFLNGLTFTLHEESGISELIVLDQLMPMAFKNSKSLRCYYFDNRFDEAVMRNITIMNWEFKHLTWQDECTLPDNEVFNRMEVA